MSIRDWFRPKSSSGSAERTSCPEPREPSSADDHTRLSAWLTAMERGELCPPREMHDGEAWNRYWRKQIEVGAIEQGFNDAMSSDSTLIPFLVRRRAKTILCAGNGLSDEARALALHGFEVTALDISDIPRAVLTRPILNVTHPNSCFPEVTARNDGTLVFSALDLIAPELCPQIHRSEDHPPQGKGSLCYITGDLMDPSVCKGPFDAVIERRTVQLFPTNEQNAALDQLAARLAPRALFISHQHLGNWKPDSPRQHYASAWFGRSDFSINGPSDVSDTASRVARLWVTTG